MVRNYVRKRVRTYTDDDIVKCVAAVNGGMPMRKASEKFGITYSTVYNRVKQLHQGKSGGQKYLPDDIEERLIKCIDQLTEWKVPFDAYGIRCLVRCYLDKAKVTKSKFRKNMPGPDWVLNLMKRHNLTKRVADNVKASRAEVSAPIINEYFRNLRKWLEGIPPGNIYNFDETNMTDNPGSKSVVVRRGRSRVERRVQHSKTSTSVMFAGNANGDYIPPMVVYKSKHLYEHWVSGGPIRTLYDHTKSGWFDSRTFKVWFFKQFLPCISHLEGPVVLIGDNLGSHFSSDVINACLERNIYFICLPPNSTHLCQPLDVAVFRPAKTEWREILDTWRRESRCQENLPKNVFPLLLRKLMQRLKKENLIAGFKGAGIFPIDANQVLKRLPTSSSCDPVDSSILNESVMRVLKENCGLGVKKHELPRKRGRKVTPGERVVALESNVDAVDAIQNDASTQPQPAGSSKPTTTKIKKRSKKAPAAKKCNHHESPPAHHENDDDDDDWVCQECSEHWENDGTDIWVVCDTCDGRYHLQCSGIQYEEEAYYDLDLGNVDFQCIECDEKFELLQDE